jgi:hypothetical protein
VGRAEVRELDWAVAEHAERAKAEAAEWAQQAAAEKRGSSSRSRSRRRRRSSSGTTGGGARRASLDQQQQQQQASADPAADADAPPSSTPYPPFDAILAADCVYSEGAIPVFLDVVLALSGRQTSILVANERRSHTICDAFERAFGEHFALKRIPYAKLDPEHRHPLIELWQLKRKRAPAAAAGAGVGAGAEEQVMAGALLEGLTLREEDEGEGDQDGGGGGRRDGT